LAGIYIHIPFCKQACNYCNFHFEVTQKSKHKLIAALVKEIELTKDFLPTKKINTIYFGGGTPSLLNEDEFTLIFNALHTHYQIDEQVEITLEANPDDITPTLLQLWKNKGVNRLSVGLQSFNEDELKWMNRAHNASQSLQCLDDIFNAGFSNFSVDLIYGSPILTNQDLIRNIEIIAQKNIPHISCYALTVEKNTQLNKLIKTKKVENINSEKQAEQFDILLTTLKKYGYEQYEISNFCKPNFKSKHNSSYWQSKPYLGIGPSAHTYDGKNMRRWNIANNALYISSLEKNTIPYEAEILTAAQIQNEYVMTALRTAEGINIENFTNRFGKVNLEKIITEANKIDVKKIIISNETIALTDFGKFYADGIAASLFL
jgi:oxygen-independent coproporphyrinogen III oxidase